MVGCEGLNARSTNMVNCINEASHTFLTGIVIYFTGLIYGAFSFRNKHSSTKALYRVQGAARRTQRAVTYDGFCKNELLYR